MLGSHPPGVVAGKGGLLEVPTLRLVDVPGQQAPAVGEPEGLEVLSGGGRGSVLAGAVVGGQRGCEGVVPKIACVPPPHSTRSRDTYPSAAPRGQSRQEMAEWLLDT